MKLYKLFFLFLLLTGCAAKAMMQSDEHTNSTDAGVKIEKPAITRAKALKKPEIYPKQEGQEVHFKYYNKSAGSVSVAGDFNNWSSKSSPLVSTEPGVFELILEVPKGTYSYKLIVDGDWITDPLNPDQVSDGYGGNNSLLRVK